MKSNNKSHTHHSRASSLTAPRSSSTWMYRLRYSYALFLIRIALNPSADQTGQRGL